MTKEILDSLARRMVCSPELKVFDPVVVLDAILVVNTLAPEKRPPEVFAHNKCVLSDIAILPGIRVVRYPDKKIPTILASLPMAPSLLASTKSILVPVLLEPLIVLSAKVARDWFVRAAVANANLVRLILASNSNPFHGVIIA